MNKNIVIGIAVVVLITGGIYWFIQSRNSASNTSPRGTAGMQTSVPAPATNPPQTPAANPLPAPVPAPTPVTATAPAPAMHNVTIQNFAFSPSSITINIGDTVVWTNKDPMGHTVTGNNGGPSSQTIGTKGAYSYTFNSAGTFAYHCAIHPYMAGTVVVTQ